MDFSWSELLVVGIVALIIIGPKDLPGMFRELGRFTAKVRSMGRDFSRAMEQAAKDSGVKDVAADLRKVADPKAMGLEAVKSAADRFEKWDPIKNAARPSTPAAQPLTPPPMPPMAAAATAAAPAAAAPAAAAPVAAAPVAAAAEATASGAAVGPNTAALAERMAARKAAAVEAANLLRASAEPAAEAAPAPPVRRAGRVRKRTDTAPGDVE